MSKVYNIEELKKLRSDWKSKNKKVVFTNGVFDVLHRGHVEYLKKASELGHYLIIGINSDASVKKIKGPLRPINTEFDRAFIISEFRFTSGVIIFNEETPINIIKILLPDVLVKGADWKTADIVGKNEVEANGGEVRTIEFVPEKSTSGTIEKILKLYK